MEKTRENESPIATLGLVGIHNSNSFDLAAKRLRAITVAYTSFHTLQRQHSEHVLAALPLPQLREELAAIVQASCLALETLE